MSMPLPAAAELFSIEEIARAAGVSPLDVDGAMLSARVVPDDGFVNLPDAVRCVRLLRGQQVPSGERELFAVRPGQKRATRGSVAASGAAHAGAFAVIAWLTLGLSSPDALPERLSPARLVFLATPGPGGGGGGGGARQPAPPAKAKLKGSAALRSPVPPPRLVSARRPVPEARRADPPPVRPSPKPAEPPPPPEPTVAPPVVAPVVTAPSDTRERAGVLGETAAETESRGPGSGTGAGTGTGTGIGEGEGAGIGPGSGGGTGGGPYRAGSGITAPELLHEVRPEYTEDARRMNIEGDVVLEIVVRRDGSVSDVRVLRGLGGGLERRAVDAVRHWRFAPARRHGTPVDVIVEVAVEFKLR